MARVWPVLETLAYPAMTGGRADKLTWAFMALILVSEKRSFLKQKVGELKHHRPISAIVNAHRTFEDFRAS
jgi:hypothetical protein